METRPDITGFGEALDRKRAELGSPIVFLWPVSVTFPPDTPLSPTTGQPFDPTILPTASSQASASAVASVFFKAVNRGGASNSEVSSPIGHDELTRVFVNLASADGLTVMGEGPDAPADVPAAEFVFHGARFKIYSIKNDEIVAGYVRTLVYGAGIGADTNSGFSP